MQAMMNIEVLNAYEAKKLSLLSALFYAQKTNIRIRRKYEVVHHTEFLKSLLDDGRLTIEGGQFKGERITFHDPAI
jgi:Fe-S oxidoreductase